MDYLNPSHPRYAPKLAATVRAWLAVENTEGKSPKTALTRWLRENASWYELTDSEGKHNETGIEECAKVANWEPKGGAPKTPDVSTIKAQNESLSKIKNGSNGMSKAVKTSQCQSKKQGLHSDDIDEIPF